MRSTDHPAPQMLDAYVAATNDTSILDRALPLAEKELAWWNTNRTSPVTSPYTNKTYSLARYAVNNTAPRPESYLTGSYPALSCHYVTECIIDR